MDVNEVSAALVALSSGLKAIESAVELKAQTSRIRNVLSGSELDEMIGNTVVALRQVNAKLKEELTK